MRILLAALAWMLCAQAAAQQLHKCRDAAGKLTYASQECGELGLKPAGEIQQRSSVAPAFKPPPAPAARPKPAASAQGVAGKAEAPKAEAPKAEAPKEAERRCFTVKTAKGTTTRCNDVPEESK